MKKQGPYRFSDDMPLAFGRIREQIDALPVLVKGLLAETFREGASQFPGEALSKIDNATEILIICANKGPTNAGIRSMIALYPEVTKVPLEVALLNPTKTVINISELSPKDLSELEVYIKIGLGSAGGYIERNVHPSRELVAAIDDFCLQVMPEKAQSTTFVATVRRRLGITLRQLGPSTWWSVIKRKKKK